MGRAGRSDRHGRLGYSGPLPPPRQPGQETFSDGRAPEDKSAGPWIFIPGAVLALAVGAVSYSQTGHYQQVQRWQQAVAQTPALLARVQDPKAQPLDEDELRRLALGYARRCGKIRTLLLRIGLCSGVSQGPGQRRYGDSGLCSRLRAGSG
ncbi:cytochrome c heme lyase subunit CcmL / Cytochrome c heme lyase subunit CcmH [Klebsiella michiganensis]|uniref:Cytochrome c heme lyase subunit CcmL / Cytochrome c heme lyase subunit CcmH n=1 Tax=Klebsiella michiganensis TaxID=1134687 RepID=A0A7H4PMW7_9ENTR|nr:cytochrome c heme lyase subunit CcmL / Cytochrome c heme lyase subunit CcmH [Klebsiella michiganensis]